MLEYRFREKVNHGSSDFPFAVYTLNYSEGAQQILPLHWHEEIEFIYIRHGSAVFSVNHIEYPVQSGDCLIINSGELHSGYARSPEPCAYSSIVFKLSWLSALHPDRCQTAYLNPLLRGDSLFPPFVDVHSQELRHLRSEIKELIKEYTEQTEGFELLLKGRLYKFLVGIRPYLIPRQQYFQSHIAHTRKWKNVTRVLEYIDANYKHPLTLEELAEVGSMTPSHLCRLFKQLTGSRPIEYINMLRINNAAMMIQTDSCSIIEAAMENGYQHLSYFSKQFRKYKQMTPSAYKRLQMQQCHSE